MAKGQQEVLEQVGKAQGAEKRAGEQEGKEALDEIV